MTKCGIRWMLKGQLQPPCERLVNAEGRCPLHCRRKLRGKNRFCRKLNIKGRNGCKLHGGRAQRGALAGAFKTGKFSEYVPKRWAELLTVPESVDILDLQEHIKLLRARLIDLMQHLEDGISGRQWENLREIHDSITKAVKANDAGGLGSALQVFAEFVSKGHSEHELWTQIEEVIGKSTKVVESQRRRAVETSDMMAKAEVLRMYKALCDAIKLTVTDDATRAKLAETFGDLTGGSGPDSRLASARSH